MDKRWIATMSAVGSLWLFPAQAADLPQKAAPAGEAPSLWKGCYIGIEGSGDTGSSHHVSADPATGGLPITSKFQDNGGSVGGTVGCNYEIHSWVFGIENDLAWKSARGGAPDLAPFNLVETSHTNQNWFDSVRGRVGVLWDRPLLAYMTAGAAFSGIGVTACDTTSGQCASETHDRTGWIAGVGLEYATFAGMSVKFEFLHADFGTARYFSTPVTLGANPRIAIRDVGLTEDLFRFGLNWRFTALP